MFYYYRYIKGDIYNHHICYTSSTTLYTDISTVLFSHIVLNDGQWSVGFVLDSNDLTSNDDDYQQRVLKRLTEGRRECHIEQRQKLNIKQEDKDLQSIIQSLHDELRETRNHHHRQLQQTQQAQQKIQDYQQQLQQSQHEVQETNDQYQQQLQQQQQRIQKLEHQLQESQHQLQDSEQQLQESQQQLQQSQDEIQEKKDQYQRQLQQQQQWIQELEHQLQQSQDEIQETRHARDQYQQSNLSLLQRLQQTEQARQDIEQQLEQLCSQQDQPHWVVGREEVIMTQEVLGKGSYGKVKVAVFRGLRVAAKSLHNIIISEYTQDHFFREMDIASRVRHPNLVQFIGATTVGTPIILMEIMATSLYNELQKKAFTQSQILGISCNVASALNYLHLWKPDPIIHRDISSPNILLEPSVGDSFKAKVTDYGAANLQQQAKTNMPGNPSYASPESHYPDDHSPAMDVYSYSVLLMEMILHCPPAMTVPKREEQANHVSWPPMSSLIQRCLNRDRHCRPTMSQILDQLKQEKHVIN